MKSPAINQQGRRAPANRRARAFTLIEIMAVVGVMGVILAFSVPSLYQLMHKEGFRKSVNDIVEVCQAARARAILQGVTTQVIFYPRERRCELSGGTGQGDSGGLVHSAQVEESTVIEMLDVNLTEFKDDEIVRVNFYPEGTCDELIVILRSDKNEWRKISLEITTGLVSVESDPYKWR